MFTVPVCGGELWDEVTVGVTEVQSQKERQADLHSQLLEQRVHTQRPTAAEHRSFLIQIFIF